VTHDQMEALIREHSNMPTDSAFVIEIPTQSLISALAKSPGQTTYAVVFADSKDDVFKGRYTIGCLTGNGVESSTNAQVFATCYDSVPLLIEEIRRLRALVRESKYM
jgi:hypothetical protein